MKKLLIPAMLLAFAASPAAADNSTMDQSVYRTVETTIITNDDLSQTYQTITTVYYFFGVE